MIRPRPVVIGAIIAFAAAVLYLPDLAGAPFYLNRDEMFFGLTAQALATTGFDANGHYLPLYTQSPMRYGSEMWFQPALMYSAALAVKIAGLTEGTIRLPMVVFAIVDIVLVYFIGLRLFRRELPAVAASVLLAMTPAHYINSRVAMDFQAPLPFLLAWLLCALVYFDTRRPGWLFAAGLSLGIGWYTYIAAYMWMPVYGLLTMIALFMRRDSLNRHVLFAAAFAIPALSSVPFLISHPTVIRDVMWHYDREQPQTAAGTELFLTYFDVDRFIKAAGVYRQFWNPRFLFVDGPGALWAAGVLLLPTAGLLVVGIIATLRRKAPEAVLLLGGLLTAAIPASLVGDIDAIHRASAVLPFAVIVAVAGLDSLWTVRTGLVRAAAFIIAWAVLMALASEYHDYLPKAQALIRASTVPVVIAGLCALIALVTPDACIGSRRYWLAAGATVAILQTSCLAAGYSMVAWLSVASIGGWLLFTRATIAAGSPRAQVVAGVALAAAACHFMTAHADYSAFARIGPIPATAIIVLMRTTYAAAALAAFTVALRWMTRETTVWAARAIPAAVTIGVILLQFGYFHVDRFSAAVRSIHALAIFAAAAVVAALLMKRGSFERAGLAWLAAAGMLGVASLQFGAFHHDYFTRYRDHAGQFDTEGNARIIWEAVIDEAGRRDVPQIYFGSVGPYGFSDLYWQFYAIKHHREDLLARTIAEPTLNFERLAALPPASLVITSPSPETDEAISRMMATHQLGSQRLLVAPDGRSKFWLLETGGAS